MKRFLSGLALLGLLVAEGANLPLETRDGEVRFGGRSLAIRFSTATGLPTEWLADGKVALVAAPSEAHPLEAKEEDGRWSGFRATPYRGEGIVRVDARTVKSRVVNGPWTFDCYYELHSERSMARRWFEVEWTGETPTKIRGFLADGGRLTCTTEAGGYLIPAHFPRIERSRRSFAEGRTVKSWKSPFPLLGDDGAGRYVSWTVDELVPYADAASNEATESRVGFSVKTWIGCQGHMRKGVPQKVGDVWMRFGQGTREDALTRMGDWFRVVGQVPPADRPDWLKKLTLYSMHPGGTTGSLCRDWGGFPLATENLPRIRELGCNAVWLMPLEDKSIYWPRDYYKLQEGIGTPEDYKRFVVKAHDLGMKVWQDCVPHGGGNANARAKAHPEWLAYKEDGTTLDYWCFDFLWPTWIDYMAGVVGWYTKEYGLDGFRIDAVTGSKIPNWSEKIPYSRASLSQSQGGLAMQRALRKAVKAVNPDGANLAEAGASIHGAASDATYDFALCYTVLRSFARRLPSETVPQLRRWLHEQKLAEIPDLVRMRHSESHDSLRAALQYGIGASEAMMALISWIPGIPLVYQEMEDASYEAFREIFRIRAAHDVLTLGDVNYLEPTVSDGVFACWRTLGRTQAIPLVNFNGTNVVCTVRPPSSAWSSGATFYDVRTGASVKMSGSVIVHPLKGFGSTVLVNMPCAPVAEECPPSTTWETANGLPPPELRLTDGGIVKQPYRLTASTNGATVVWRVASDGGVDPGRVELVFRVPDATRWFAQAAEGDFGGPFRVRHPTFDAQPSPIYRFPQGGNELWNAHLHPFGLADGQARVGADCGATRWTFEPIGSARLLDRIGKTKGLHAAFRAQEVRVTCGALPPHIAGTGDRRLTVVPGGWLFDNGRIRLQIQRNGSLVDYSRKEPDGTWTRMLTASLYTDKGYGDKRYAQESEVETEMRFSRDVKGVLTLRFAGHLRNDYRFAKMRQPIAFVTTYRLSDEDCFGLQEEVCASGEAEGGKAFLAWMASSPSRIARATFTDAAGFVQTATPGGAFRYLQAKVAATQSAPPVRMELERQDGRRLVCSNIHYKGCTPESVVAGGDALFVCWQDNCGKPFPPGVKASVLMVVR